MLPTSTEVEPATSWSPVGRHIQLSHRGRKHTFYHVRPKTQISLHSCTVWLEFWLSAWRNFASLTNKNKPSEDSDQTARMRRLIWIFARHTCPKVLFLTLRHKCQSYLQKLQQLKALSELSHEKCFLLAYSFTNVVSFLKMAGTLYQANPIPLTLVMLNKLRCHTQFKFQPIRLIDPSCFHTQFKFQPIRLIDPSCLYKFTYLVTKSVDQYQLASSEVNWSGSTLFANTGHIWVQQDLG